MYKQKLLLFLFIAIALFTSLLEMGCANIGMPTGGPRDSTAPILVKADPENEATNYTDKKLVLNFDEYVELKDQQTNIIVSPLQTVNPIITSKLKTVTIRFKDSLQPNTTYSINFGKAIVDVNEGNPAEGYVYTFSTGPEIDTISLSGIVKLAGTGEIDSTLQVYLYQNPTDSSVKTKRPKYISRVDGQGNFKFQNLPKGIFKIYALKDGDGGKTYNSLAETFAFLPGDKEFILPYDEEELILNAYEEEPRTPPPAGGSAGKNDKLRYTSTSVTETLDIQKTFDFTFTNALRTLPPGAIVVGDSSGRSLGNVTEELDSLRKTVKLRYPWRQDRIYSVILNKGAIVDTFDNTIFKSDTLRFKTKAAYDYGRILIRFKNLDSSRTAVLQLVNTSSEITNYTITGTEWRNTMFLPGEYRLRVFYDDNKNGILDPGNFKNKKQPEIAIPIPQKLGVRADWDNELDIIL